MEMLLKPSSFALQGVEVSHMLSKVAGLLKSQELIQVKYGDNILKR